MKWSCCESDRVVSATAPRRFDVLGVPVDVVAPDDVISRVRSALASEKRSSIVFSTVSTILTARKNSEVMRAIHSASVIAPDGMPLVWLGRAAGLTLERVYGPDFMLALFAATGGELSHFFYGGKSGVADTMAARLTERYPDLQVTGCLSPSIELDPTSPPEEDIDLINHSGADILWVGLGHPKQELFMHYNRDRINVPVMAAVGAAFDFHAGLKKEAPAWMKRSGLQWLHRLVSEPRRLWRRYLIGNTVFLLLLLKELVLRRSSKPGPR